MGEAHFPAEQPQAGQEPRISTPDVDSRRAGHSRRSPSQAQGTAVSLIWRVRRRDTIAALRRSRAFRAGPLTVRWIPGDPGTPVQVAFSIPRSVGSAVARNRLRRRLRAAAAEVAPALPGGALLVGVSPAAAQLDWPDLLAALEAAVAATGTDTKASA